jgi:hypothetical protein
MRNLINRNDGNSNGAVALRISAFAKKYDMHEVSVRRMIRAGELRTLRVGHIVRVIDDVVPAVAAVAADTSRKEAPHGENGMTLSN